jgi:outer membrane lipase/esterase
MRAGLVAVVVFAVAIFGGAIEDAAAGGPSFAFQPSGLTRMQRTVGDGFRSLCLKLDAARFSGLTPLQNDLLVSGCDKVDTLGQGRNLAAALETLSPSGAFSVGSNVTETSSAQFALIGSRLVGLRQGTSGLSLGGLKLFADAGPIGSPLASLDDSGRGASADSLGGPWGLFVSGTVNFGDRDATSRQPGFDFSTGTVSAGVDYRFQRDLVAGLALTVQWTQADVDGIIGGLGDVATHSYGLSTYGTYYRERAYLDWQVGAAWNTYDTERRLVFSDVNRTARGDTSGQQVVANVGAGYQFPLGATTLTPYGRLEYVFLHVNGFRERSAGGLNLKIDDQDVPSLRSALGGRITHAVSTPIGVFVPQVHAEWRHEFLDDRRTVSAQFVNDPFQTGFRFQTDRLDRNYGAVGAGVSTVLSRGVSVFVNYETVVGLQDVTNHSVTGGARLEF